MKIPTLRAGITAAFTLLAALPAWAVDVIFKPVTAGVYAYIGDTEGRTYDNEGLNANIGLVVTLAKLMKACALEAKEKKIAFKPFSLQDCRPMGATAKLDAGDTDTTASLNHTNEKMVKQVYDRRQQKKATGARLVNTGTEK